MTLGQLRTFLEVARAGSIGGAATTLVVTAPSVSAAVAALKRELGVELVERTGRGIRLTPAGEEFAQYAAQILGLSDRAVRATREVAGEVGLLRVVGVTTAGEYVLPPILAEYRARHPRVQLALEVGNRATAIERLLSHEADLAVGGRPPAESGIRGEPFLENALVVVASKDHPLRARRKLEAQALAEETWLLREPGSGTRETTEEFWAAKGIAPASVMTVGSNGAIKQGAAVGLGVTLMSVHAVRAELESGVLARLRVEGTPLRRSWHVHYLQGVTLPRSAEYFLDLLRAQSSTQPERSSQRPAP
ncbi:LysR family transcriptional regulator [soil metagenome]